MLELSEGSVQGVRYAARGGQWLFSLPDVALKFGYSIIDAKYLCESDEEFRLPNGQPAIKFDNLVMLAKAAPKGSKGFLNALGKEMEAKQGSSVSLPEEVPDFSNPAKAARAWAELYEEGELIKKRLQEALTLLGDGKEFKIVRKIPWLDDYFAPFKVVPMIVGNCLARMSKKAKAPVQRCHAFGYQASHSIGMYHLDIIQELKERLDKDPKFLGRWRLKAM